MVIDSTSNQLRKTLGNHVNKQKQCHAQGLSTTLQNKKIRYIQENPPVSVP
jgi:hypothetical protein